MSGPNGVSWVQNLLRPAAWPHSVQDLRLIETHISWVLLTGEFAYKIKKPVNLGFVDFTSLGQRKFYCEEELRINRRLAAEIYLDVVEIRGSADSPQVSGDSNLPLIDYAVRMTQFDDSMLLSHLAARRLIQPKHVDLLADEIAGFHQRIAVAASASPWAQVGAVIQPALDNFSTLFELFERFEVSDRPDEFSGVHELFEWTKREANDRSRDFASRADSGFVRECHGDMHLGNMFLSAPDRITVFDGIEFNPELRWTDVINEVAFTMMDLADRGYGGLSWRFLNRWLEHTGDFGGLSVLKWYLVYRAMVRAKVGMLRVQQTAQDSGMRTAILREVRDYLKLAGDYIKPKPTELWITCGVSGSGKTYGSQSLIEQKQLIRIRSDVERKRMVGLAPTTRTSDGPHAGLYTPQQSEFVYSQLLSTSEQVLRAGHSVIVDATFLKQKQRADFRRLADKLEIPFHILWFEVSPDVIRERILQRSRQGTDASDATVEIALQQLQSFEPLLPEERACVQKPFSPSSS